MRRIVLISGQLCSGKSLLANRLKECFSFLHLKTSEAIAAVAGNKELTRIELQAYGLKLDHQTSAKWLLDEIKKISHSGTESSNIVVDAVRTREQIDRVRDLLGLQVVHVHLTAPINVLTERFAERKKMGREKENLAYSDADLVKQREEVDRLIKDADLCIDTSRSDPGDTLVRVASRLRLYATPDHKCVDVIVGGQYGSEGKGQIAAYLSRNYQVLVRVGGPNAGHSVRGPDDRTDKYHHLPSGSRDTEAEIIIGAGAVLNPENILREIEEFGLTPGRIYIDPQAMTISAEDIETEKRLIDKIGSTGQGVGAASARKILDRVSTSFTLARDIPSLVPFLDSATNRLERAYRTRKKILLEGTQGSALSIHHGSYPHVTSRDTNVAGCLAEAGISASRVRRILMVVRTYPIRVDNAKEGTSGWMKNEIDFDVIAKRSGLNADELKKAEITTTTNKKRRVSEFDWELYRRSCALNAPTDIVLTFSDYIRKENRDARRFDQLTQETIQFVEELERVANAPVSLISTRFDQRAIIDRRDWW